MHEWTGFIKIDLREDQEIMLTLALDPHDYNNKNDPQRRYTIIQNAFFQLGALEATKITSAEGAQYLAIFTTYFPNKENHYNELYEFLKTLEAPFTAYFQPNNRGEGKIHKAYNPKNSGIEILETVPAEYSTELQTKIQTLREWVTISDMYIHIPPPTSSVFKRR